MSKHKHNYVFKSILREIMPLSIKRVEVDGLVYYEALFMGGNLYAFLLCDLLLQLMRIHGFKPQTLFYPELKYKNVEL